ncbi:hypothetical protein TNCV_611591 [Trichonephila clavipes]|nr:hypothetical protein TNCV_611591 [Trichonephila clavipes]
MYTSQDALCNGYRQSRQCTFNCFISKRLIEDETFNDIDNINNLTDYEDGQKNLRVDKFIQDAAFQQIEKKAFS